MRYAVVHTTDFTYSEPVPLCQNEVHLKPRVSPRQECLSHRLSIRPQPREIDDVTDYFGNPLTFFAIQERHHELSVTSHCEVRITSANYIPPDSTVSWETARDQTIAARDVEAFEAAQFLFASPHVSLSREL